MLTVTVLEARPAAHTAAPAILFRLRVEAPADRRVHAAVLRCQTRIEPRGRRYTADEQGRLYELFGDVSGWDRTLQPVTWGVTSVVTPAFAGHADVDLPVACTYDLQVAAGKYLHAIRGGDVPLSFVFSGTIFSAAGDGPLQIEPVPWDVDARFRMPARAWHEAMDRFFPGGGWIRLNRETIDALQAFRGRCAVVTWDEALARLLQYAAAEEGAHPLAAPPAAAHEETR